MPGGAAPGATIGNRLGSRREARGEVDVVPLVGRKWPAARVVVNDQHREDDMETKRVGMAEPAELEPDDEMGRLMPDQRKTEAAHCLG